MLRRSLVRERNTFLRRPPGCCRQSWHRFTRAESSKGREKEAFAAQDRGPAALAAAPLPWPPPTLAMREAPGLPQSVLLQPKAGRYRLRRMPYSANSTAVACPATGARGRSYNLSQSWHCERSAHTTTSKRLWEVRRQCVWWRAWFSQPCSCSEKKPANLRLRTDRATRARANVWQNLPGTTRGLSEQGLPPHPLSARFPETLKGVGARRTRNAMITRDWTISSWGEKALHNHPTQNAENLKVVRIFHWEMWSPCSKTCVVCSELDQSDISTAISQDLSNKGTTTTLLQRSLTDGQIGISLKRAVAR